MHWLHLHHNVRARTENKWFCPWNVIHTKNQMIWSISVKIVTFGVQISSLWKCTLEGVTQNISNVDYVILNLKLWKIWKSTSQPVKFMIVMSATFECNKFQKSKLMWMRNMKIIMWKLFMESKVDTTVKKLLLPNILDLTSFLKLIETFTYKITRNVKKITLKVIYSNKCASEVLNSI